MRGTGTSRDGLWALAHPGDVCTPVIHHPLSIINPRAFTLIELLVAISIVVLLISILLPSLQRARKQARATACQSNIRQAGFYFAVYASENDGKLALNDSHPWEAPHDYDFMLLIAGKSWERKELLLCPVASKPKFTGELHYGRTCRALGDTFSAWVGLLSDEAQWNPDGAEIPHAGSYGFNFNFWIEWDRKIRDKKPAYTPVYIDSAWAAASADDARKGPPPYDGYFEYGGPYFTAAYMNRHSGGVNCLFYDWSVRKVGVKELWTLRWSSYFDTHGPWTKAGGVKPGDWPQWMRGFKDY